jgi:hypothetical protein
MIIHTKQALARRRRRLDQRMARAQLVLRAMRGGAALQCQMYPGGPVWTLTTGERIESTIAHIITQSASVLPVGDCLFDSCLSQTWRWWNHV